MQTKRLSMFEVLCNTFTGLFCAWLTWIFIVMPWCKILGWDLNRLGFTNIWCINGLFTTISVLRGYFWRRTFNRIN